MRTLPTDPPQVVPRAARGASPAPAPSRSTAASRPGRIYDVVYRARDPRVVGVGLAGTRDLVSFFKHATAAAGQSDAGPPRSRSAGACRRPGASSATSSTKASTKTNAAASSSTACSIRWAAPAAARSTTASASSRATSCSTSTSSIPVDMFPFTDDDQTDPETGAHRRPARARAAHEHGAEDVAPADQLGVLQPRRLAGAHRRDRHARRRAARRPAASTWSRRRRTSSGRSRRRRSATRTSSASADMNPLVYTPVIRALFRALDRWVADGVAPPPSRYPTHRRRHARRRPARPAGRRCPACALPHGADDDLSPRLRPGLAARASSRVEPPALGSAVCQPRAGGGRRRQRPGRHPPAADRRAAGHATPAGTTGTRRLARPIAWPARSARTCPLPRTARRSRPHRRRPRARLPSATPAARTTWAASRWPPSAWSPIASCWPRTCRR